MMVSTAVSTDCACQSVFFHSLAASLVYIAAMPSTAGVSAREVAEMETKFQGYCAMTFKKILELGPRERQQFFDDYAQVCQAVDDLSERLSQEQSETTQIDQPEEANMHKSKRVKIIDPTPFFRGDVIPLEDLLQEILPVYQVMRSNNKRGGSKDYKYVQWQTNNNQWQANAYVNGKRWNLGNYRHNWEAARAVAIATAHRCHHTRIVELMKKIPEDRFEEI